MYEQRIKTVRRNLANRGLEQMLVCDPRSIHYLTQEMAKRQKKK